MKSAILITVLLAGLALFGCARVNVGGTEKPIKVDVTMRVDIYQHVVKEIDDIENMIRSDEPIKIQEPQSLLNFFCKDAWAAELSETAKGAAKSRQERLEEVENLLSIGAVGEGNNGFLAVRKASNPDAEAVTFAENADRKVIYNEIAGQNNLTPEAIENIYAEKMQSLAPSGSPIQTKDGSWIKK